MQHSQQDSHTSPGLISSWQIKQLSRVFAHDVLALLFCQIDSVLSQQLLGAGPRGIGMRKITRPQELCVRHHVQRIKRRPVVLEGHPDVAFDIFAGQFDKP